MFEFLQKFLRSGGAWVTASMLAAKACMFFGMLVGAWWLPKSTFGEISTALNFLGFFTALVGGGSYQAALRFGALTQNRGERENLYRYLWYTGLGAQAVVTVIFCVFAAMLYYDTPYFVWLFAAMAVRLLGLFFLEGAKAQARGDLDNVLFSKLELGASVSFLLLIIAGTSLYGAGGYLLALALAPFSVFIFKRNILHWAAVPQSAVPYSSKELWTFAWYTALSTQVAEWIFLLDLFFIGHILTASDVAEFRVHNTIPVNLLFIPYALLQTQYPELCRHISNPDFHRSYFRQYFKLMLPIVLFLFVVITLAAGPILGLFGKNYNHPELFTVLMLASASVMLLRAPYGYGLSALGKPRWTLLISVAMLPLLALAYGFVLSRYGLLGAAWVNVAGVTFSGLMFFICYQWELKKLVLS